MRLSLNLPAGDNTVWSQAAAEKLIGQRFHVLAFGEAYLAQVERATLYDQGASVQIEARVEDPQEEDIPEPVFTYADQPDLPDDACLRMTPEAECPAAGSPRCASCVWRPAEEGSDG